MIPLNISQQFTFSRHSNIIIKLYYIKVLMKDFFKKNLFASSALCIFSFILFYFLLHPAYNWEHSENWFFLYACLDKKELYDSTFPLIFDLCLDGGTPRTRLLSWTSFVLNTEMRKFLFDFIPYHATISFTWIFSVICLPITFYKLLRTYAIDKEVSILATILLLSSVGWLSGHLMYFHQAKPMSSFFLILSWFFARKYINERDFNIKNVALFAIILLIGTHWDELFFFSFAFIPLSLTYSKNNITAFKSLLLAYLISLPLFYISTTYFLPYVTEYYNLEIYDFWNYAFDTNSGLTSLQFSDFIFNAETMLTSHLIPMDSISDLRNPKTVFYFVAIGIWLLFFFTAKSKLEFFKWTFVLVMFCLFQSLILSRRLGRLFLGAFYWGHLFSIFYAFLFAYCLGSTKLNLSKNKYYKFFTRFLFIFFIFSAFNNSLLMNNDHMVENRDGMKNQKNIDVYGTKWPSIMADSTDPLEFSDILLIWRERENFSTAKALFSKIPEDGYWMYMHLYMRHHKKVENNGKTWGF